MNMTSYSEALMAIQLSRKDRREVSVLLKKRQSSVIDSLTDETTELWKLAQQNLQWLCGKPIKTKGGAKVDFSMMDYLMAITRWTAEDQTSDLLMIQRFWITMYPYLDNVISNLSHYKAKFAEIYGIEGETLKNYALQNLELQLYRKFFKEELPKILDNKNEANAINEAFKKFHEDFKAESDAEIEKAKAKEGEWRNKQEEKARTAEEANKKKAFANSLRY